MHEEFYVDACVKLKPTEEKSLPIEKVCAVVGAEFVQMLNDLNGEVLLLCTRELDTRHFSLVSIKITPIAGKIMVTANTLLNGKSADPDPAKNYRKIEFAVGDDKIKKMNLYRLIKFMEAKAMQEHGKQLETIVYMRISPVEKDDVMAEKF